MVEIYIVNKKNTHQVVSRISVPDLDIDKNYVGSVTLEMHLNEGNILRAFINSRKETKVVKVKNI